MAAMTTSKWLMLTVSLTLVGVAWIWVQHSESSRSVTLRQSITEASVTTPPNADPSMDRPLEHVAELAPEPLRRGQVDARISATSQEMMRYHCVDIDDRERTCDVDATAANSEAEALWLAQHGYPSRADLDEYPSLSVAELDSRAEHDLAFAVLRARRRIEDGERGAGLTQLMRLVKRGDLYALYEMSRAYRSTDIYDSGAYLRLAYLLGDRRASRELYATFPDFGIAEFDMIDERAASLRLTMFPSLAIQPRPFQ